eukprot:gene433-247_t
MDFGTVPTHEGDPEAWAHAIDELSKPVKPQKLTKSSVLVDSKLANSLHGAPKNAQRPQKLPDRLAGQQQQSPIHSPSCSRAASPVHSTMRSLPASRSTPFDRNGYITPFLTETFQLGDLEDDDDDENDDNHMRPMSAASRLHSAPHHSPFVNSTPWVGDTWPLLEDDVVLKRQPRPRFNASGWRQVSSTAIPRSRSKPAIDTATANRRYSERPMTSPVGIGFENRPLTGQKSQPSLSVGFEFSMVDEFVHIRVDEGWCNSEHASNLAYLALRVGTEVQHTKTFAHRKGVRASWHETLEFTTIQTPATGVPTDVLWCDGEKDGIELLQIGECIEFSLLVADPAVKSSHGDFNHNIMAPSFPTKSFTAENLKGTGGASSSSTRPTENDSIYIGRSQSKTPTRIKNDNNMNRSCTPERVEVLTQPTQPPEGKNNGGFWKYSPAKYVWQENNSRSLSPMPSSSNFYPTTSKHRNDIFESEDHYNEVKSVRSLKSQTPVNNTSKSHNVISSVDYGAKTIVEAAKQSAEAASTAAQQAMRAAENLEKYIARQEMKEKVNSVVENKAVLPTFSTPLRNNSSATSNEKNHHNTTSDAGSTPKSFRHPRPSPRPMYSTPMRNNITNNSKQNVPKLTISGMNSNTSDFGKRFPKTPHANLNCAAASPSNVSATSSRVSSARRLDVYSTEVFVDTEMELSPVDVSVFGGTRVLITPSQCSADDVCAAELDGKSCDVRILGKRIVLIVPPNLDLLCDLDCEESQSGDAIKECEIVLWTVDGPRYVKNAAVKYIVPSVFSDVARINSLTDNGQCAHGPGAFFTKYLVKMASTGFYYEFVIEELRNGDSSGFGFGVCYEVPSIPVDDSLALDQCWLVGFDPQILCYPTNKTRHIDFPAVSELQVGDRIGVLVSVCAEMVVLKNEKEVLRVVLRGCPQRLPNVGVMDLSHGVKSVRLVDGSPPSLPGLEMDNDLIANIARVTHQQHQNSVKQFAEKKKQLMEEAMIRREIEDDERRQQVSEDRAQLHSGQGRRKANLHQHRKKIFDERNAEEHEMVRHLQDQEREYVQRLRKAQTQRARQQLSLLKRKGYPRPGENKANRSPSPAKLYEGDDGGFDQESKGPNCNNKIRMAHKKNKFGGGYNPFVPEPAPVYGDYVLSLVPEALRARLEKPDGSQWDHTTGEWNQRQD